MAFNKWPYNWGWNSPFLTELWDSGFSNSPSLAPNRVMWARVNFNTPFPGLRRALPVPTWRANMAGRGPRRFGAWRPGGLKMGMKEVQKSVASFNDL